MKGTLNILILPEEPSANEELEPHWSDAILTNYPSAEQHRYLRSTMRDCILAVVWNTYPGWPCGARMNLDVMCSRRSLNAINGRPC